MEVPASDGPEEGDLVDKGRLASFSDNVISIAMTLLVLDVRFPSGLGHVTVGQVLRRTGPNLLGFVLSFVIVGVYWVGHHMMIRAMRGVPRSALWANNLFLLCISLLPATAALLGGYPGQRASAVLYGLNLALAGSSMLLLMHTSVRYLRRNGLAQSPTAVRSGYWRPAIGVVIAMVGIALAWVSPWANYAVYCLTPAVYVVVQLLPNGGSSRGEGTPMTPVTRPV